MGFTRVDNWLFDVVMPSAHPNTFKVVSAVVRATTGWGKESKELTLDDFQKMTGIVGRSTTQNAVQDAIDNGFITREKSGRGFAYSTKIVLQEEELAVPKSYHEQSQNRTAISPKIVLPSIYKESIKEIYIPPYEQPGDFTPFPESEDERMEMVSVLSGTVKDKASGVKGEARFNQAADELIKQGVTIEQVRAFRDWWAANGYYKGKPSLTSLLQEIENSINGVVKASANGNGRHDYKDYWREVQAEIRRNGRMSKRKWDDTTAKVIRRAGGFPALCNMSFPDAERAFSAAYQDMT